MIKQSKNIPIIISFFILGYIPAMPAEMVLIPSGKFLMGSDDVNTPDNEKSARVVYLNAFYIGKYEITNTQYKWFTDANPEWQKDRIDRALHDGTCLALWEGNDYPIGKAAKKINARIDLEMTIKPYIVPKANGAVLSLRF